jgi:hypothetical protein
MKSINSTKTHVNNSPITKLIICKRELSDEKSEETLLNLLLYSDTFWIAVLSIIDIIRRKKLGESIKEFTEESKKLLEEFFINSS